MRRGVIVFETIDLDKYPLPGPGLLWARALLSRISHPVGGAGDMPLLDNHGAHDDQSRLVYMLPPETADKPKNRVASK